MGYRGLAKLSWKEQKGIGKSLSTGSRSMVTAPGKGGSVFFKLHATVSLIHVFVFRPVQGCFYYHGSVTSLKSGIMILPSYYFLLRSILATWSLMCVHMYFSSLLLVVGFCFVLFCLLVCLFCFVLFCFVFCHVCLVVP